MSCFYTICQAESTFLQKNKVHQAGVENKSISCLVKNGEWHRFNINKTQRCKWKDIKEIFMFPMAEPYVSLTETVCFRHGKRKFLLRKT